MSTPTISDTPKLGVKKTLSLKLPESITPRYLELPSATDPLQTPDPTAAEYRSISRKTVYHGDVFNCIKQQFLKEVFVSGMKLVWDENGDKFLTALNNQRDLKRITIVADTVQFNMPVTFPQSEVLIFARELIFTERGSLDITPVAKLDKPAPDQRIPSEHGLSGEDGQAGAHCQSIILNVGRLFIPDFGNEQKYLTTRLFAKGANGQPGGDGGLLDQTGTPIPPAVSWKSLFDKITNTPLASIPFGLPFYVGTHPGRGFPIVKHDAHLDTELLEKQPAKLNHIHLLHLHATVHFPSGYFYLTNWTIDLGSKLPLPANGRSAYPSGVPGDGGNGGQIYYAGPVHIIERTSDLNTFNTAPLTLDSHDHLAAIVDVSGGMPGLSEEMNGAEPALSKQAAYATLEVKFNYVAAGKLTRPSKWDKLIPKKKRSALYDGHIEDAEIRLEDTTPKPGSDAPAPKAFAGKSGSIHSAQDAPPFWLHPFNTEAALNYAKHALLVHNRELAREVITTYLNAFDATPHPLSGQLVTHRAEFELLLRRLDADLDIYGNQLGWVPHLSVLGSYSQFQMLVKQAFNTMYLCYKMKAQYEDMENNLSGFTAMRKAVVQKLADARKNLIELHNTFGQLQQDLDQQLSLGAALQAELNTLFEHIKVEAEIDEINKAVYLGGVKISFGSLKLITGGLGILAQVIPVGQPYLGSIAGTGTKVAGSLFNQLEELLTSVMEADKADAADDGTTIIKQASQLLKQHQDTISSVAAKPFTQQLNSDLSSAQKQLADLGKTTRELANAKDDLKHLLDLPEDNITEQLERLMRLDESQSISSVTTVGDNLREIILQRIRTLEENSKTYKKTIASLRVKSKETDALASKAANLAKQKQRTETMVKQVVQGVGQMTGDVQGVFDGVRSLCLRKEDLEPKIARQIEKLKDTVFGKRLATLYDKVAIVNSKKEEVMRRLERCQFAIQESGLSINQCIEQLQTIDNRILGFSGALDHSVYSLLVSLDNDARSTITRQLYYFAKSYHYRYLKQVNPEFYLLDNYIERFKEFLERDRGGEKLSLDAATFATIYQLLQADLCKEIRFLADDVQHNQLARKSTWLIHARELMDESTLQQLNKPLPNQRTKKTNYEPVVINFVKAGYSLPNAVKLRIVDIALKSVSLDKVEQFKHGLNFSIKFTHSGLSILCDGEDYYLFRAQNEIDKISWEFTVNINSNGQVEIKPVAISTMDMELLQKLSGSDTKVSDLLSAYSPSGSSDIMMTRTDSGDIKGGAITDFMIEVTLEEFHHS